MGPCRSRLWTIGSGKGGVGKSFLTASMAAALAREGNSVIIVDASFASPTLHAYLGINAPGVTLLEVLERNSAPPEALMSTTEPRVRFLSCVGDELGMADLAPGKQQQLADCLSSFDADFVLIDLGSGASFGVLDFFNLADEAIVAVSPDPASMQCAYGFIRNSIYRKVQRKFGSHTEVMAALRQMQQRTNAAKPKTMTDFFELLHPATPEVIESIAEMVDAYRPLMLMNMAASEQDQRMAEIIQSAAKKFLNVEVRSCGLVQFDPMARRATQRMSLLDVSEAECTSAREIRQIALRLAGNDACSRGMDGDGLRDPFAAAPTMGLNDNLAFMGKHLHIQTEDLGDAGHCITTNVFCDGRVILSTKSEYPESLRDSRHSSQVVELMRAQHFNVIREIENGKTRDQPALA